MCRSPLPPLPVPLYARVPPQRVVKIPPRSEFIGPRRQLPVVPPPPAAAPVAQRVIHIPPVNPLSDVSDDAIGEMLDHLVDDGGDFVLSRELFATMESRDLLARFGFDLGDDAEPTAVTAILDLAA